MRTQFLIIALLLLTGCTAKHSVPEEIIPCDVKNTASRLEPTKVGITFAQSESPILFVYDSNYVIKIIQTKPSTGGKLLDIYKLGENCPLYSAIDYGGMEGQFLSAVPYTIQEDILLIHDITKDLIAFVDLNKALKDSTYIPNIKKFEILTNFLIPYQNGILYLSPYWTSDKRVKNRDKGAKFLFTDSDLNAVEEKGEYITTNITAGSIISNKKKDRILYFDAIDDLAEVYDYSLNLIKTIKGPDDIKPIFLFPNDNNPVAVQIGEYYDTYLFGACCSTEDVFAAYQGKTEDSQATITYIFNFDWDGHLKNTYFVDGLIYGNLSASSDGKIVYASVIDSLGFQHYNQYTIPH